MKPLVVALYLLSLAAFAWQDHKHQWAHKSKASGPVVEIYTEKGVLR